VEQRTFRPPSSVGIRISKYEAEALLLVLQNPENLSLFVGRPYMSAHVNGLIERVKAAQDKLRQPVGCISHKGA
jgi:hypothetical protein